MGAIKSQVIQSSALIETSTWTKAVMSKACKSFGINVDDLEHEVLDDILCMKEKRIASTKTRVTRQCLKVLEQEKNEQLSL